MSEGPGTPRAIAEWRNRVRAEYGSAGLAAQASHWLIQCALPEELVLTSLRIVGDELAHARLSHEVVAALGGGDDPLALDVGATAAPAAPEGPLASLVDTTARNFCLGETFAVPLFHAMREGATLPAAAAALDRILRDEAIHRAFGWQALDALLELDAAGVRARLAARLPGWLGWYARAYGQGGGAPLDPAERAAGLLSGAEYAAIFERCLAEQIRPRFAARGIAA